MPQNAVAILNPVAGRARGQELARLAVAELKRRFGELGVSGTLY